MSKKLATMALAGVVAMLFAITGFNAGSANAATATPQNAMIATHTNSVTMAQSGSHEGQDKNNVVCGGVPTKKKLLRLARGGADSCGHHDIKDIWARWGITLQVAQSMHAGTLCATVSQDYVSAGRKHSPRPYLDHPIVIDGHTLFWRPLAGAWGAGCYHAWIGYTEDGRLVAILMGCGNPETKKLPPRHKPRLVAPSISAQAQACVEEGESNGDITVTVHNPNSRAIVAIVRLDSKTKTVFIRAHHEVNFVLSGFGPGNYSGTVTLKGTKKTKSFSVTVEQCTHPTPVYSCDNLNLTPNPVQAGESVTATVTYTAKNGATFQSVHYDWGDGSATDDGTSKSHTYSTAGNYMVIATVTFSLPSGGSASATSEACSKPLTVSTAPSYSCTGLNLSSNSLQTGQSVTATVTYAKSGGVSFQSVSYNWGDSNHSTGGTSASHTYNSAGTYTVIATVNFTLPNGSPASATSEACQATVTVSPPPFLTASCTGFEEISGDGSFLVDCTASTNSGQPIYLNASSNDSNSYVSGINCSSNGGTQACPASGGTFEFRVNGVNDGSNTVMSSITVTITSGNLTWTQTYTFKVDPKVGGF